MKGLCFVGWNFLGTFKLASAGPFVASFLPLMGFRFDLSCIFVFSDQFFVSGVTFVHVEFGSGSIVIPPFDERQFDSVRVYVYASDLI